MKMPHTFAASAFRHRAACVLIPAASLWLLAAPAMAQTADVKPAGMLVQQSQGQANASAKDLQKAQAEKARQQLQQARERERAEIVSKREIIDQQLMADEKLCYQKFAVEACLADARSAARAKDEPLRERELQINSEERKQKAEERLKAIEEKKAEKAAVPMKSQQRENTKHSPSPTGSGAKPGVDEQALQAQRQTQAQQRAARQADYVRRHEQNLVKSEQGKAEREAKAKADYEAKLKAAADHKASALKQAQERGKTAAPLPAPAP